MNLDPHRDADEIIRRGEWHPYANMIIDNGKWKCYRYRNRIVAYTFKQAAEIEAHQKSVDEKRLAELRELFSPLPPLSEGEKKTNEQLYWGRIRHQTKCENDEGEGGH